MMSRRDYRLIAQGLSVARDKVNRGYVPGRKDLVEGIDTAINELCYTLGLDNAKFNSARFKYAIHNGGSDRGFKNWLRNNAGRIEL